MRRMARLKKKYLGRPVRVTQEWRDRLEAWVAHHGKSLSALATELGISRPTLTTRLRPGKNCRYIEYITEVTGIAPPLAHHAHQLIDALDERGDSESLEALCSLAERALQASEPRQN